MITDTDLKEYFSYHPPTPDQIDHYAKIREAALQFAHVIRNNTPAGADQTYTIRLLRQVVMNANQSVALGPYEFNKQNLIQFRRPTTPNQPEGGDRGPTPA